MRVCFSKKIPDDDAGLWSTLLTPEGLDESGPLTDDGAVSSPQMCSNPSEVGGLAAIRKWDVLL